MTTQANGPQGQWVLGQDWSPLGRMMRYWKSDHLRFIEICCSADTQKVRDGETDPWTFQYVKVGFDILAPGVWRLSDPVFADNFARFMSRDHTLFMPLDQMQRIPYSEAREIAETLAWSPRGRMLNGVEFMDAYARDPAFDR